MNIIGAGLAGLIAGHVFPSATIIERNPESSVAQHSALLRFRSDAVSLVTGIPFRRVTVRKGVWVDGRFVEPNIRIANQYSIKCTGRAMARSIWDTSSVERFVAPEDFYARMVEACRGRIRWESTVGPQRDFNEPLISTAPLHQNAEHYLGFSDAKFDRSPVLVDRWRLPGTDLHQTVYFPSPMNSTYRASITGDMMIVESINNWKSRMPCTEVLRCFGLEDHEFEPIGVVHQSHGKIAPIEERLRRELIHRLTTEASVYSVGRFATWRNILLDDVVKDLRIIRSMIEQNDAYNRRLQAV